MEDRRTERPELSRHVATVLGHVCGRRDFLARGNSCHPRPLCKAVRGEMLTISTVVANLCSCRGPLPSRIHGDREAAPRKVSSGAPRLVLFRGGHALEFSFQRSRREHRALDGRTSRASDAVRTKPWQRGAVVDYPTRRSRRRDRQGSQTTAIGDQTSNQEEPFLCHKSAWLGNM